MLGSSEQLSHQNLPSVLQTESGLNLDSSILWLDANGPSEINFISSAANYQHKQCLYSKQVLASEQTIKLLESLGHKPNNALVCQYNRPFSIGNLKLELLPSGNILGGSSLYVETKQGGFLYAPILHPSSINIFRSMKLRSAYTLVLGCFHPEPQTVLPSRKKEKERLLNTAKQLLEAGKTPVVLCKPFNTGPELTLYFTKNNIPVAVHNNIFRINRVYESYGASLGKYSYYSRKYTRNKVVLFPTVENNFRFRKPLPQGELLIVDETLFSKQESPEALRQPEHRFVISNHAEANELRTAVQKINPQKIYFYGPYANRYLKIFEPSKSELLILDNLNQPSLF